MGKRKIILFLVKAKGIFLFIFFFTFPVALHFFLTLFRLKFLLSDPVFFMLLNYGFCFFIFGLLNLFLKKKVFSFFSSENWFYSMGRAMVPAIMAFGIGFATSLILIVLFQSLPFPDFLKEWITSPNEGFIEIFNGLQDEKYFKVILMFFFIIVAGPVFEEIIFRGFLQESIQRLFKKDIYVLPAVSLVFGSAHFNSLSNMIFAFVVGLFLSKKRKESGNINTSIWIHAIVNLTGLLSGIIYMRLTNKF